MFKLSDYSYGFTRASSDKAKEYKFYMPISEAYRNVWISDKLVKDGVVNDWLVSKSSDLQEVQKQYSEYKRLHPGEMVPNPFTTQNECSQYFHVDGDASTDSYKISMGESYDMNINEEVAPEDVNLSSFKNNKELNDSIWENNKLKPKVRKQLLKIANDFYEFLDTPWLEITDIIFTGSLANYNWSKFSDVDLHLVYESKDVKDKLEIAEDFFKLKKWAWAEEHENLFIYGYPVELYVQPSTQTAKEDAAVYSVQDNEWVVEPSRQSKSFDKEKVKNKASEIMNNIDEFYLEYEKLTEPGELNRLLKKVNKQWDKIKDMRKIGLDREGEFSFENIVFKVLRRTEYMEKITTLKHLIYDKENTINESVNTPALIDNLGTLDIKNIEGRFLSKDDAIELQKEIESKYVDNTTELFNGKKDDIRMKAFNYEHPIARKTINGVELRIAEGLIRNKRKTYLLYANGNIIGEFYSVQEIKNIILYIENELIKELPSNKMLEDIIIPVEKGDTVLMGKFKNKKTVVKDIGKDQHGMPTINGKKATTFRMTKSELKESIFEKGHFAKYSKGESDIKDKIKNLHKLPKELKEFATENSHKYSKAKNGVVSELNTPAEFKKRLKTEGLPDGFSVGVDKDGYFIHTHRARSKSYETLDKIPKKDIIFVNSTG